MTALDPRFIETSDLQSVFRDDATGLPLSGGIITFYSDINRSLLKPVYQLSSTGGDTYAYNVLPNPCVLSMAGTFQDGLGNDIIPYYYPFTLTPDDDTGIQELYYITVQNSGFTVQFTRQGWPQGAGSGGNETATNIYNFARNGQFYGWSYLPSSATGYGNVAGYSSAVASLDTADDWTYFVNDTTQTININRGVFTQGQAIPPADPVYYWQYANSNAGSAAATSNFLLQSYKSVQTLNGQTVTISFYMDSNELSFGGSSFSVQLEQFFGTGGSPHASVITPVINLTAVGSINNWIKYSATVDIPIINNGFTLGSNGDDALYLIFNMPLNIPVTINLANVLFEIGSTVSNFPFISNDDQYNRTDTVSAYSIFRTGDVKMSLRNSSDIGWLLMDDTTIGNSQSGATHYGWALFNLYSMIWNNVNSVAWAPLYNSSGVPQSAYGASASADWNAGNQLALTKALGRVLAGAGTSVISYIVTASSSTGLLITLPTGVNNLLLNGDPVTFHIGSGGVLPTGLVAATTYYVIQITGNTYKIATTLANSTAGTAITYTDSGTNPFYIMLNASTWALGQLFGEQSHSIIPAQLPVTSLSMNTQVLNLGSTGSTFNAPQNGGATPLAGAIQSFGASALMNVMQPTTFLNVYIKL